MLFLGGTCLRVPYFRKPPFIIVSILKTLHERALKMPSACLRRPGLAVSLDSLVWSFGWGLGGG